MKILLTGASGFVGSVFYSKYKECYEIDMVSFKNNVSDIVIKDTDAVVHLSALVHQMGACDNKLYHDINARKTFLFAEQAKASGVRHFIFMSSVKVYGEESAIAYSEDSPCNPKDPYGQSKLDAERLLLSLEDERFKISIIRTPLVYGAGVKANVFNLIRLIDKSIFLPFANIKNRRSMVYVENLVHLVSEIIRQEKRGIFLASDNHPISTTEFVEFIASALDKKVYLFSSVFFKYVLKYFKKGLYSRLYEDLYVDNTKTCNILNLSNPYTSQEGIEKMTKWYKGIKK